MFLPSTSSSPTPSISPAVKRNKIYSIFPQKLLKLHAASYPNYPFNHVGVFPHFHSPAPPVHSIMFNHVFVFLIFSHLLLQSASCSHTWGKTPCPRSVFLVWKAGFQFCSLFVLFDIIVKKWVFWFWHSFRRSSMQSFQNAKVITDSIYTKNFFQFPCNEHHTESSPPKWKRRWNQPEPFFVRFSM